MIKSTEQPKWRKASGCGNGTCVEVARVGARFLVRDSKDPQGDPLSFTSDEWAAFIDGVKRDEFSL